MDYHKLTTLVASKNWADLEKHWLGIVEQRGADPARLLPIIDAVVKAGKPDFAATLGWAWLTQMKEKHSPREALQLGRGLLLRLPDGDQLREEILALYVQTHKDHAGLDQWVDKSGLKSGKSVRRALRYLDNGLKLAEGALLVHRTEDEAAQVLSVDMNGEEVEIRTPRRTRVAPLAEVIEDYDVVADNDFRALRQLQPEKIRQLLQDDPATLAIGIVRGHNNQMDRDALKLVLVGEFLSASEWSDWWTKLRNAVKKTPNLRIEGRSPMMVIYDPVGQTPDQEAWAAFGKAKTPREWLEILETYLRDTREAKINPDTPFLDRVQAALVEHIERFTRHKEPTTAFATALVIERVAADGLPVKTDAHGMAVKMLGAAKNPVSLVAAIPDSRLWSLAVDEVKEAFAEDWPKVYAELILYAPAGTIDTLVKAVEGAGQGGLLPGVVARALADPGRHTDVVMWAWKGPKVKTDLGLPSALELLNLILALVGPARQSEGKAAGQHVNDMRASIRAGLTYKDYARFREVLTAQSHSMALTIRRQVERADGLGPAVRDEMLNIVREVFPAMYVKQKVAPWEDESVLYFTEAGLKAKESEIEELVNVKMRENAKAIGEAAALGDLSENSEYKFALEERDLLRARLAQLNAEIALAKVLNPDDVPEDHVGIGQRVTLKPAKGGAALTVTVQGAGESDLNKKVFSYKTPIARKLLGKRPGETVAMQLEESELEYVIDRVENALRV